MRVAKLGLIAGALLSAEAASQTPQPNDPLVSRDQALKGVVGYVGPRMDPKSVRVDYPADLGKAKDWLDATVDLTICVDQGGVATAVYITHSSGEPILDAVAVEAASKASYNAAAMNGAKMPVCGYLMTFDMRMPPKPAPAPPAH